MAKVDIYNLEGSVVGQIDLSEAVFGIEPNEAVLHMVVKNQLANRRQGTSSTKTRSEVRGGGKKPWRQKGTGRARHGSTRSPIWVGGGVTFGPKPRSFRYSLPKKVRRLALKSALSSKVNEQKIVVVEAFDLNEIKTKVFKNVLDKLNIKSSVLVVEDGENKNLQFSAKNIMNVKTAAVNTINVYDLLKYDTFLVSKKAVEKIQEVYA